MLTPVACGARWSVYSRDIGRNRPVALCALQMEIWARRPETFKRAGRITADRSLGDSPDQAARWNNWVRLPGRLAMDGPIIISCV